MINKDNYIINIDRAGLMSYEYYEVTKKRQIKTNLTSVSKSDSRNINEVSWRELKDMRRCNYKMLKKVNQEHKQVDKAQMRERMRYIEQEWVVFGDTVANQIILLPVPEKVDEMQQKINHLQPIAIALNPKLINIHNLQNMDSIDNMIIIVTSTQILYCTIIYQHKQPSFIILHKYPLFNSQNSHLTDIKAFNIEDSPKLSQKKQESYHYYAILGNDSRRRLLLYIYYFSILRINTTIKVNIVSQKRRQITFPQKIKNKYDYQTNFSPSAIVRHSSHKQQSQSCIICIGKLVMHPIYIQKSLPMRIFTFDININILVNSKNIKEIAQIDIDECFQEIGSLHNNYLINRVYCVQEQQENYGKRQDCECLLFLYQKFRHNQVQSGYVQKKQQKDDYQGYQFDKFQQCQQKRQYAQNCLLEDKAYCGGQSCIWAYKMHTKAIVDIPGQIINSFISKSISHNVIILTVFSCCKKKIKHTNNYINQYFLTYLILEGLYYRSFTVPICVYALDMQFLHMSEDRIYGMDGKGNWNLFGKVGKKMLYMRMCEEMMEITCEEGSNGKQIDDKIRQKTDGKLGKNDKDREEQKNKNKRIRIVGDAIAAEIINLL